MRHNPSSSKLRPDLANKPRKQQLRRLPGERHDFKPKTPPVKEPPRLGPEESHHISIEKELQAILTKHEVLNKHDLITDLLKWRRA